MGRNLVLTVNYDPDPICPITEEGSWQLYSFNRGSIFWKHPNIFVKRFDGDTVIPANIGIQRKLDRGLAFWLQYYEHGLGRYDIRNQGPKCMWDTVSLAGILIWKRPVKDLGLKTFEERKADAEAFLERVNRWLEGDVYMYYLERLVYNPETEAMEEHFVDSVCNLWDIQSVEEYVKEQLQPGDRVKVVGELAHLVNLQEIDK